MLLPDSTIWLEWRAVPHPIDLPAALSDEQLALGLQQNDAGCLAPLVERHHSPLLGFLYRLTGGDRPLAEDLVQETFLRVIRNIHQYRSSRPFKPWLYAIAVNLARDHFKSADSRRTGSITDSLDLPVEADVDESLLAADDARRVAAALLALPVHQREAVTLRYYQNFSLDEIAGALNIPTGTVKSRLSIGLNRLRDLLEKEP